MFELTLGFSRFTDRVRCVDLYTDNRMYLYPTYTQYESMYGRHFWMGLYSATKWFKVARKGCVAETRVTSQPSFCQDSFNRCLAGRNSTDKALTAHASSCKENWDLLGFMYLFLAFIFGIYFPPALILFSCVSGFRVLAIWQQEGMEDNIYTFPFDSAFGAQKHKT